MSYFRRNVEMTPIDGIAKNYSNLSEKDRNKPTIVLIGTGSFNPAHNMHVKMYHFAKMSLEKDYGYVVLGAFISPSHDKYVLNKLKREAISGYYRCEILQLIINDFGFDDWLFVDKAESFQSKFSSQNAVVSSLRTFLDKNLKFRVDRVAYVAGWDLFLRCRGHYRFREEKYGICVVRRSGFGMSKGYLDKREKSLFVVDYDSENNKGYRELSSTKLREILRDEVTRKDISPAILTTSAAKFVKENYNDMKILQNKKSQKKQILSSIAKVFGNKKGKGETGEGNIISEGNKKKLTKKDRKKLRSGKKKNNKRNRKNNKKLNKKKY